MSSHESKGGDGATERNRTKSLVSLVSFVSFVSTTTIHHAHAITREFDFDFVTGAADRPVGAPGAAASRTRARLELHMTSQDTT